MDPNFAEAGNFERKLEAGVSKGQTLLNLEPVAGLVVVFVLVIYILCL